MIVRTFVFFIILVISSPLFSHNFKGIFVDFNETEKVRKSIHQKDESYLAAYKALIVNAEQALKEGPFSVMDKKRTAPSGDKHDYLSGGPYWWPDPSKPDAKVTLLVA